MVENYRSLLNSNSGGNIETTAETVRIIIEELDLQISRKRDEVTKDWIHRS